MNDKSRLKWWYLAALCVVFAGFTLYRFDLFLGAFSNTLANLSSGWASGAKTVVEIILFVCIIFLVVRTVPSGAVPARDFFIVLAASAYGGLAETWGTRSGLWTYYTGERPPVWIIPAWPIGALVIERLSRRTAGLLERFSEDSLDSRLYRAWAVLFCCVFIPFAAKSLLVPAGIAVALLSAFALFPRRARLKNDLSALLTGTVCVFFADLWGTTNHCWSYYVQANSFGLARGISFGMLFDSALVLAAIKTADVVCVPRASCGTAEESHRL